MLEKLAELWRRERRAAREKSEALRRDVPLAERVERGIAARDLSIADTDASPGGRVLAWLVPKRAGELEILQCGPGDPVRLWRDRPDSEEAVLGTVAKRREAKLGVVVEAEALAVLEEAPFHLDRDEPTATFDRGDAAIARFLSAKAGTDLARMRAALLGEKLRSGITREPAAFLDRDLNEPQKEAVRLALGAPDLALVHGPPGTGKTRTLVEVVRQAVAAGERVLVTAASNAAVDNLAARLLEHHVALVRIGHPARVSEAIESRTLDALLEESGAFALARTWQAEAADIRRRARSKRDRGQIDHREMRQMFGEAGALSRDARKHLQGAQEAIVSSARVVCATAAGADSFLLGDATFDLVVLDEATQAVDPIALVALARAKRAVLAGDPKQLPPTVISLDAARDGLGTTFFERLAESHPGALRMLVVQHRMSEELMAFPSKSMYGGKLVAAPPVAKHRLEDLGVAPDAARPVPFHFVDSSGKGWTEARGGDDPSTSNRGQAERVVREARRLLERGLPAKDLAIITPYDAQVRLLRELLPEVEIASVDAFQGREKEAVIVDTVRSNETAEIGFLADYRRMNVALTRAKRFLLVVGDGATLGADPFYSSLLSHAESTGAWLSAWTDEP